MRAILVLAMILTTTARERRPSAPPGDSPKRTEYRPFKTCWEASEENPTASASLEIEGAPLEWVGDQDFVVVHLRFVNTSGSPLWLNKRGAPGGLVNFDTEVSVSVKAVTGCVSLKGGVGERRPAPKREDYVVVPSGHSLYMQTVVSRLDYQLAAGEYELGVCFWDKNRRLPSAPKGVVLFSEPLPARPVKLIRRPSSAR